MREGIVIRNEMILLSNGTAAYDGAGGAYRLKQDLPLGFLNWQGAYAGVYIEDPMSGESRRFSPALEEQDVESAVDEVLDSMARNLTNLSKRTKLEGQFKKAHDRLSELLEAA